MEENNKLIAEFMGAKWEFQEFIYKSYAYKFETNRPTKDASMWHGLEHLQYHSSWDWLMPVVEKIERFEGVEILLKGSRFQIKAGGKVFKCHTISIQNSIYKVVVEFIKWYNLQK